MICYDLSSKSSWEISLLLNIQQSSDSEVVSTNGEQKQLWLKELSM